MKALGGKGGRVSPCFCPDQLGKCICKASVMLEFKHW